MGDDRRAVVRNDYLPPRTVQMGIGEVEVRFCPRCAIAAAAGATSAPACCRRTSSARAAVEDDPLAVYLKGVSAGDYQERLSASLGDGAKALSADTVSRLKQ